MTITTLVRTRILSSSSGSESRKMEAVLNKIGTATETALTRRYKSEDYPIFPIQHRV